MKERNVFTNLNVVDFSWAATGPLIAKYLADFGATVVKVESSKTLDPMRYTAPFKGKKADIDKAGYFTILNANKYSLRLDMKHPKGIDVARRLIDWADVIVENFRPGVMEKWGLDYEQVKKLNPRVIYMSASSVGNNGPYRNFGGAGFTLVALGGFSNFIGYPGDEPMRLPQAYTDFIGPRFGITALVSALISRRHTGHGVHIDLSQLECGLQFLLPGIMDYTVNNREPKREGNSCSYAVPHGIYRCQGNDRWIAIAVFTDREWAILCKAMGKEHLAEDRRFATFLARKRHEEEVDTEIESWTRNFSPEELMSSLQTLGIAAGVVQNAADAANNEQLHSRGFFWTIEHPRLGNFPYLGQPFKFSQTPPKGTMPSPCLGEHTEYVCTQLLGISDEDFTAYLNEGVFE